jgi:hypothetical protein
MPNAFEEANHTQCFNHILQLLAKTLLKLFNVGMSLMNPTSEGGKSSNISNEANELLTLLDNNTIGDDEADDDEDGDSDGYSNDKEDLDGDNKPNDTNDKIDKLNELDEEEWEKVLVDMAVV